jgi:hypothetical protein
VPCHEPWLGAGVAARLALAGDVTDWRMSEYPAQPPARHPYLIMKPKSGDGKVAKFDLVRKAEDLGAEVFLIGGPEPVDVAEVARQAVAAGAGRPRRGEMPHRRGLGARSAPGPRPAQVPRRRRRRCRWRRPPN